MKTTSYEISKQLKEAGFEAESKVWRYDPKNLKYCAYDLEAILSKLPKQHDFLSRGVGKYELQIWFNEGKAFIGYQAFYQNFCGSDKLFVFEQDQNESLADTAARLWLKLKERNLIEESK